MAKRYDALIAKHGTYREFEDAVWNTLGETSVAECQVACQKYLRDLADARLADLEAEAALTKEPI